MPANDPRAGEHWLVRTIPGGTQTVKVIGRATAHDLAAMPDSTVVFVYVSGYADPNRLWTMALRTFVAMFSLRTEEVEDG